MSKYCTAKCPIDWKKESMPQTIFGKHNHAILIKALWTDVVSNLTNKGALVLCRVLSYAMLKFVDEINTMKVPRRYTRPYDKNVWMFCFLMLKVGHEEGEESASERRDDCGHGCLLKIEQNH